MDPVDEWELDFQFFVLDSQEWLYPFHPKANSALSILCIGFDVDGDLIRLKYLSFNSLYWIPHVFSFDEMKSLLKAFNSLYWIQGE